MPDGRTTVDSTVVTDEQPVDAAAQELIIQTEQIGWNQFRFRPASSLAVGDFKYDWTFGDGATSSDRVVEHTFSKPGRYTVSLRLDDPATGQKSATMLVRVGFFHLANWRLWVIIGLLALIIILAATTAGVSESLVPMTGTMPAPKPESPEEDHDHGDEIALEPLSDDHGDLDSLASTGEESDGLSNDLALLESIGSAKPITPAKPVAIKPQLDEATTDLFVDQSEAVAEETPKAAKPKAKKKTTKKRPAKKRTIKVKNVS